MLNMRTGMRSRRPLEYCTLQRELWKRAIPYTFARGQGGVIAFAWAVGAGLLSVVYHMPAMAGALTGAMLALEGLMARGYLRGGESRNQILREALARHLDLRGLEDGPLRAACARAQDLFAEIAAKVDDMAHQRGASADLERLLAAACAMLVLQLDAAHRVEEYSRILGLLETPEGASRDSIAGLRDENVRTLKKLIVEERQLVTDVNAWLETALLQSLQATRSAAANIGDGELAHHADEVLHDLQAVVEAHREAAGLILRTAATAK